MTARTNTVIAGMLLAAGMATPAFSADISHRTDYSITLSGLPIARASFDTEMRDDRYTISGSVRTSGLVDVISTITALTEVSGNVGGGQLRARTYSLTYTKGKKTQVYQVGFRNGNVTSSVIRPQPKRNAKNWVEVKPADLRAVLDPISAVIIPGDKSGSREVCSGALPIFDGESRLDLVLSPKGTKSYSTDGFSGDTTVCSIRYVPKSGYRKGRKDIDYLRNLKGMEIWFAKSEAANLYAPVYVRIPTQYGPLSISAVKFGS